MAPGETEKRGGPYSKKEQEHRRIQVYKLHFDQNLPAVKIAERLGYVYGSVAIHRNDLILL